MDLKSSFLTVGMLFYFISPTVVAKWEGKRPTLIPISEAEYQRNKTSVYVDKFITNGSPSPVEDIKFMVTLQVYINDAEYDHGFEWWNEQGNVCDDEAPSPSPWRKGPGWFHFCGGALIETDIVLTAAHCVDIFQFDENFDHLRAGIGWNDFRDSGETSKIRNMNIHPNWDPQSGSGYDLAILHLETPAILSEPVETISLGAPTESCAVHGWGKTDCGYPVALQSMCLTRTNSGDCKFIWKLYGELAHGNKKKFQVSEKEHCYVGWNNYYGGDRNKQCLLAIGSAGETGLCDGDDGGVLVCGGKAAGVVSWFDKQCLGCRPQVFAKIDKKWIKKTIRELRTLPA